MSKTVIIQPSNLHELSNVASDIEIRCSRSRKKTERKKEKMHLLFEQPVEMVRVDYEDNDELERGARIVRVELRDDPF